MPEIDLYIQLHLRWGVYINKKFRTQFVEFKKNYRVYGSVCFASFYLVIDSETCFFTWQQFVAAVIELVCVSLQCQNRSVSQHRRLP